MRAQAVGRRLSHVARAQAVRASVFDYELPQSRIATRPLTERSSSKLLVVPLGGGTLTLEDRVFRELPDVLPRNALLVRNASRVMRARLHMRKPTGGAAEVLLLSPVEGSANVVLGGTGGRWRALIGGRRIRAGNTLYGEGVSASVLERDGRDAVVELHVMPGAGAHADLRAALECVGATPLPPYLGREADEHDADAYQTVYAKADGSVAAPTAGLHVTRGVEAGLLAAGVRTVDVTLHVGAGTFAPLGGDVAGDHSMHVECAHVPRDALHAVAAQVRDAQPVVALGTTSVRTLESLYWLGVRAIHRHDALSKDDADGVPEVGQWEPYEWLDKVGAEDLPSVCEALQLLLDSEYCDEHGVALRTKLLIVPGYPFELVDALVTNFHQPRSTLLMLVAAFAGGEDKMQRVYEHALKSDYRFLSYGDSSLYIPPS